MRIGVYTYRGLEKWCLKMLLLFKLQASSFKALRDRDEDHFTQFTPGICSGRILVSIILICPVYHENRWFFGLQNEAPFVLAGEHEI